MTARTIRWGVLGGAKIAREQFLPALAEATGSELAAVASRNLEKAKSLAAKFGAGRAYESYEKLLADDGVDAVYIPLPNHLHKEWTVKAARAGKHVLCEKPMGLSPEECTEMIDVCRENGVLFMEAFMYRLHPQISRVKDIIASGEIGELRQVRTSFSFVLDEPENVRMKPAYGGGALMDVGCYCINLSRYLFESEPVEVSAYGHFDRPEGIDLSLVATMKFNEKQFAAFDCSFEMASRQGAEVVGTKGKIDIASPWRPDRDRVCITVTTESETRKEWFEPANPYQLEIEHFASCILEGKQPLLTGQEGRKNMNVIAACRQSAQTGRPVAL